MSYVSKFSGSSLDRIKGHNYGHEELYLSRLFKLTLLYPDTVATVKRYDVQSVVDLTQRVATDFLKVSGHERNIPVETLMMLHKQ